MIRKAFPALILPVALAVAPAAGAYDYPTLERVDDVLTCMSLQGGQNIDNLYYCSCAIDVIAAEMPFEEYSEARTYEQYARMPAEKGALFRESARGDELKEKLGAVRKDADKQCAKVRHVERTSKHPVQVDDGAGAPPAIPPSAEAPAALAPAEEMTPAVPSSAIAPAAEAPSTEATPAQ